MTSTVDLQPLIDVLGDRLVLPGAKRYDLLRRPFNARLDPTPLAIARCTSEDDVVAVVAFATDNGIGVTARSGGHGAEGWCSISDQLVVDLSGMSQVEVDLEDEVVHVSAGARWGQVDLATYPWGYATPGGGCVDVGVAGLTQGGGIGPIARTWGLTSDHVLEARVVTSRDKAVVVADAETNPDLYWALRGGGGGNFGIVTRFTFKLRPVGGPMLGGMIPFSWEQMPAVWRMYRDWMRADPDHRLTLSPMAFFEGDGPGCGLTMIYNGDVDDGYRSIKAMLADHDVVVDGGVEQYVQPGTLPAYTGTESTTAWPGTGQFWRSGLLENDFPDEAIDTIAEWYARCPTPPTENPATHRPEATVYRANMSFAFIESLGGAIAEVPVEDTAFFWRDKLFSFTIIAVYDPANPTWEQAIKEWAFGFRAAMEPYLSGAVYVNYVQADLEDFGRAYYGDHYERLQQVKAAYDPTHVFRFPQDVSARAEGGAAGGGAAGYAG